MRRSHLAHAIGEGLVCGLIAGMLFAVAETVAATTMGMPPTLPLRMCASILMGGEALIAPIDGALLGVGLVVHFTLSGIYGATYAVFAETLPRRMREPLGWRVGTGALFGVLLWALNFQIIAPLAFPWFLDAMQPVELALHVIFFGAPLGTLFSSMERSEAHEPAKPAHAPAMGAGTR